MRKINDVFLIGDDEEDEELRNSSFAEKLELSKSAKSNSNIIAPHAKENVKSVNFGDNLKTNTYDVRRQSVSAIPENLKPPRNTKFDRNRHYSDEVPRRFVLNPSSKISLEVRRNHSGCFHKLNKIEIFSFFLSTKKFMNWFLHSNWKLMKVKYISLFLSSTFL